MFLGRHEHSLDAKGRLTLPAEFRAEFDGGAVMSQGMDGCVAIWRPEEYQRLAMELIDKARRGGTERNVARAFAAGAKQVDLDSHGRVVVPQHLREYAELARDVIVTGAFNRVEIWNPEVWTRVASGATEQLREAHDGLADMGF